MVTFVNVGPELRCVQKCKKSRGQQPGVLYLDDEVDLETTSESDTYEHW